MASPDPDKRRAQWAARYARNKEKYAARRHATYIANKKKYALACKEYYQANKKKCKDMVYNWIARNPVRVNEYRAQYARKNAVKIAQRTAKYNRRPEVLERRREQRRADRKRNPEKYRRWNAADTPLKRLKQRCRSYIREALTNSYVKKTERSMDLVGCSWAKLKAHIEKQFKDGMCWERIREIHIDHIRPISWYDLTKRKHRKECFHYTNLRPMWANDNMRKSDRYSPRGLFG
jgi:hypothetical protein